MNNHTKILLKFFLSYWLILPVVQFFSFLWMTIFEIVDYRINVIFIMVMNFIFVVYQSKRIKSLWAKVTLSFSSASQFLLIAFILNDFTFLTFLIIFTPIINLIAFIALDYLVKYTSYLVVFVMVFILLLGFFVGNPVIDFIRIQNSKRIQEDKFPKVDLLKEDGEDFLMEEDRLYVLNFWSTTCRPCIEKMPAFNKLVAKYPKVKFATVLHARDISEITNAKKITQEYNFEKLKLQDYRQFKDSLTRPLFPHLVILKNNRILYDGLPMFEGDFLNKSVSDLVELYQEN